MVKLFLIRTGPVKINSCDECLALYTTNKKKYCPVIEKDVTGENEPPDSCLLPPWESGLVSIISDVMVVEE